MLQDVESVTCTTIPYNLLDFRAMTKMNLVEDGGKIPGI